MKFGIENFRIFSEHQEFDLAPITLLTGTNNSGKSALQKAIILMKNSFLGTSGKLELDSLNFEGISKKIGDFDSNVAYGSKSENLLFSFAVKNSFCNTSSKIQLAYTAKRLVSLKFFILFNESYKLLFEITPQNHKNFESFDIDLLISLIHCAKDGGKEQDIVLGLSKKSRIVDYILTKEEKNEIENIKVNYGLEINSEKYKTQDISKPHEWRVYNTNTKSDQLFNKIYKESYKAFTTSFESLFLGSVLLDELYEIDYFNNPNKAHSSYEEINKILVNENIFTEEVFIEKYKEFEKIVLSLMINKWNGTLAQVAKTPDDQDYFFDENLERIIENTIGNNNEIQMASDFKTLDYHDGPPFFKYIYKNQKWGKISPSEFLERKFTQTSEGNLNDSINTAISVINEQWKEAMMQIRLLASKTKLFLFDNDNISQRHLLFDDTNIFTSSLANYSKEKEADNINGEQIRFINRWLKKFRLGDSLNFKKILAGSEWIGVDYFLSKGGNKIPLNDNGIGANKLVLIILQIAISTKQSQFLFEEPEIGLHPKYQSFLADMFNEAYQKFGHKFIIETHSEYLIRKLQYLTAKKKIKSENSVIYYFHHPDNIPNGEKQVKEIRIREDGMMDEDFGPGFFDESTQLTIDLLNLQNKD